jgi:hypothetical protein
MIEWGEGVKINYIKLNKIKIIIKKKNILKSNLKEKKLFFFFSIKIIYF